MEMDFSRALLHRRPSDALQTPFRSRQLQTSFELIDTEILRTKNDLCALFSRRNSLLPIHTLPDDILAVIIDLSTFDGDPFSLVSFLLVCRRWHAIVIETRSLWGAVDTQWWEVTDVLLDRSRYAPLTLRWDEWDLIGISSLSRRTNMNPLSDQEMDTSRELLENVFDQFSRLKRVRLDHADPDTYSSFRDCIDRSSDVLRYVHIQQQDTKPPNTLPLTHAPVLRSLYLSWIHPADLAVCEFPALEDLEICTLVWMPSLTTILDFMARTPRLRSVKLTSWDSEDEPLLDDERVVSMPQLEVLHCMSDNLTSSLFRFPSHLAAPRLREIYHCLSGFHETKVSMGQISPRLLPFPSHSVQPLHLHISEFANEISLINSPLTSNSSLEWLRIEFQALSYDDPDLEIIRRGDYLTSIYSDTCDLSSLEELRSDMLLEGSTWSSLFSPSTKLTSLRLSLDAWQYFLSAFLHAAQTGTSFMPSLSMIQVDCLDEHMSGDTTWSGALSRLAEALTKRLSLGLRLTELRIVRDAIRDIPTYHRVPSQTYPPTEGWDEEAVHLSRLRELVGTVTVRPDPADEIDWDSIFCA